MRFSAACISLAALAFLAHCVRVFSLAAFAFLNLFTPAMLFVQFLFVFDAVFCSSHLARCVRVFSLAALAFLNLAFLNLFTSALLCASW